MPGKHSGVLYLCERLWSLLGKGTLRELTGGLDAVLSCECGVGVGLSRPPLALLFCSY